MQAAPPKPAIRFLSCGGGDLQTARHGLYTQRITGRSKQLVDCGAAAKGHNVDGWKLAHKPPNGVLWAIWRFLLLHVPFDVANE